MKYPVCLLMKNNTLNNLSAIGTNENKFVPMLRFPDFNNDGPWEKSTLAEIIEIITPPKKLASSEYGKAGKFAIIDQSKNYICGYSDDMEAVINSQEDSVIVFGDHTCILKLINFPFIQGADGIKIFKSKDNEIIDTEYIYQYLLSSPIESTEYKRHFSDLKGVIVYYPHSLLEQRRIVQCLTSIDEQISDIKNKIEQYKSHRTGLLQKLFPPQGITTPTLRFVGFKNDWETECMKIMFEIKNGYTPSKSNNAYWENGTIPWFRMEDIRKNGNILSDSIQHVTSQAVKGPGLFPAYSIILATTATIGVHALIIVDSLANQQFTFLTKRKSFEEKLDMIYFHYYPHLRLNLTFG